MPSSAEGLFPQPVAILDLETTGSNPLRDRITEIGLITLEPDGQMEVWSSLVNPGCPIPPFITQLTGIDNDMVGEAPDFAHLAEALAKRLSGRWLVAHNARFDYGFLRHEFQRVGIAYEAPTLCTVRLSRKLFPQHKHHGLDHLVQRHALHMSARHRALGDTQAVHQFLDIARNSVGPERFDNTVKQLIARPSAPPGLDDALIDAIPEGCGVYQFFSDNDTLLYIGKSSNLRRSVIAHFNAAASDHKARRLSQQVRRVEWQETGSELHALLTQSRLVRALNPVFNRQLRRAREVCAWYLPADPSAPAKLVSAEQLAKYQGTLLGPFSQRKAALQALEGLSNAHQLCKVSLGLEKPTRKGSPCRQHQIRQCSGACVGLETAEAHRARVERALGPLRFQTWPYPGPIGLIAPPDEHTPDLIHVFDQWYYLGSAAGIAAAQQMAAQRALGDFDQDTYRILQRWLNGPAPEGIIQLPANGT